VLGRGHFGIVFRAHDLKKEQDLAVKVLSPVFPADDEEMQHFVRVVKLAMALRHPGLATLYAVGRTGPYVWIAMELVDGEGVAEVVARLHKLRKIKWRRALRVALQVGQALAFIRQRHLIHGNITPANILLTADGHAKLNDLAQWNALMGSKLFQQGLEKKLLAELPFLSPEQCDAKADVDDLSDQYNLGAVVYALLTGRPPFVCESPEALLEHVCKVPPDKPKSLQPEIPDQLQSVVLRMLAKHPEERYPTPEEFLADLEKIAADHQEEL
jgi:serine/threonine-protein kinase